MEQKHDIVLYQIDDTNVCVSVIYKDETFWLTQKAMAELFDCSSDNVSLHLKNIYKEEELTEEATTEIFSVVQKEGKRDVKRNAKCYNLDAIIAVGYRVNSKKATKFRQWATKTLKEYITKGFVLNDDMHVPVNEELIRKSQMCLNNAVMIMIKIAKPQELFMHLSKTSFILLLPVKLLLS